MVVRSRQPGSSGSSTTMAAPPWGWVGKGWYFCCCCCCRYSCCYCCVVSSFFYCFCSVICLLLLMVLMLWNIKCSINQTIKYLSMIANLKLAPLFDSSIVSCVGQAQVFHPASLQRRRDGFWINEGNSNDKGIFHFNEIFKSTFRHFSLFNLSLSLSLPPSLFHFLAFILSFSPPPSLSLSLSVCISIFFLSLFPSLLFQFVQTDGNIETDAKVSLPPTQEVCLFS